MADTRKCDFCSSRPVVWTIPCADFTVPGTRAQSTGAFLACDSCGALIRTRDREDLLLRSERILNQRRKFFRPVHDGFWQHARLDQMQQIGPADWSAETPLSPAAAAHLTRDPPMVVHDSRRPWMEAVEKQFAALRLVSANNHLLGLPRSSNHELIESVRQAETYAWTTDPTTAVTLAARSIPASATVSVDQLPSRAGFWWFTDPPTKERPFHALLWKIDMWKANGEMAIFLSTLDGEPNLLAFVPWILGDTITVAMQELERLRVVMTEHKIIDGWKQDSDVALPIAMRFFLAGCSWLQQKILTISPGHIERHRRKQLAREHKIQPPGDVKIIELRRRESVSQPAGNGESVEWSCQWIVSGHWTHQVHGAKRGERRLQYILPYVKGPADKPLRVPKQTVYLVDR